jgi:hypothetical protein
MLQENAVEEIRMHILCSITFFQNCAIYEIMRKNIVDLGRPRVTIRRMRIACWIPTATNTRTVCVIIIVFPLQQ